MASGDDPVASPSTAVGLRVQQGPDGIRGDTANRGGVRQDDDLHLFVRR